MTERLLRTILLANLVLWFLIALAASASAHVTGLLLGGAAFQASLCAYLIQRHTRKTTDLP